MKSCKFGDQLSTQVVAIFPGFAVSHMQGERHKSHSHGGGPCTECDIFVLNGDYRRELRAKDIATIQRNVDELDAREKRGLTKDQKEERDHGRKVLEFLNEGTDVR